MSDPPPILACDLSALGEAERTRRASLAARVAAGFQEIRETTEGYAARLDADPEVAKDAFEWLLLERRCCPFLRLELSFEPAGGPIWLHLGGGPGVKAFLAAAGLAPSRGRDA
jgi:hypothetical protein